MADCVLLRDLSGRVQALSQRGLKWVTVCTVSCGFQLGVNVFALSLIIRELFFIVCGTLVIVLRIWSWRCFSCFPERQNDGWNEPDLGRQPATERPHHKVRLVQLIKHHLRDWLWIAVMIALEIIVYLLIPPFHRFVDETKMQEYKYPTGPDTVPTWSIGVRFFSIIIFEIACILV